MIVEPKREILLVPLLRVGFRRAWAARDHFIRLGIVPLSVLLLIAVPQLDVLKAMGTTLDASGAEQADPGVVLRGLLLGLLDGAALTLFAVNWVRQLTLGANAVPGLGLTGAVRHIRFFIAMLVLSIGALLPVFMMAVIAAVALGNLAAGMFVFFVLGALLWVAVIARFSPSWIGIAIDARMPLSIAWSRTAGQGFKLLLALLAVQVVTMVAHELVSEILAITGFIAVAPYSFMLLALAIRLVGIAVQISILVTAFPYFLRETV